MKTRLPEALLIRCSDFVAARTGLHFPKERWPDLERGLLGAAKDLGFRDMDECIERLISEPMTGRQVGILAGNLTVGETYFFREPRIFETLENQLFPEIIRSRQTERRLRIWSAACCSGEEPYSIAVSVQKALPALSDWHVTILGTDINPQFLQKASRGVFNEWSFRNLPARFRERCFHPRGIRQWEINRDIKNSVRFSHLNLAEDVYPSPHNDTNAMDLIFCRNVLIYFSPKQANAVIERLCRCLTDGGWLVVGPTETSHIACAELVPVNFGGSILFQKKRGRKTPWKEPARQWPTPPFPPLPGSPRAFDVEPGGSINGEFGRTPFETPGSPASQPELETGTREATIHSPENRAPANAENENQSARELALNLYRQGRFADAVEVLERRLSSCAGEAREIMLLTRALANLGRLADALQWSARAVAADKLDPSAHYLRAGILGELGSPQDAALAFKRALYLDPEFALAHFALGNLARVQNSLTEARRHFANALAVARLRPRDEVLPQSDGLTAGRLVEIIAATPPAGRDAGAQPSERHHEQPA